MGHRLTQQKRRVGELGRQLTQLTQHADGPDRQLTQLTQHADGPDRLIPQKQRVDVPDRRCRRVDVAARRLTPQKQRADVARRCDRRTGEAARQTRRADQHRRAYPPRCPAALLPLKQSSPFVGLPVGEGGGPW
jgi:hypothetical protein